METVSPLIVDLKIQCVSLKKGALHSLPTHTPKQDGGAMTDSSTAWQKGLDTH